ncbi:MAG: branched-chain amino acid ABC transporter permease [Chloroflexota bacterium]
MATAIATARRSNLLLPIILGILILYLLIFPNLPETSNAQILTYTQLFMVIIMASSWNLIGGFTGYVDFGHTVFFGIGAYAVGILMATGWFQGISASIIGIFSPEVAGNIRQLAPWTFVMALPFGGIFAAIFSQLIGLPTLRLRGPYFSIAMLGTFVAMREITRISKPLTGGGEGLNLTPYLNRPLFYYGFMALMIFIIAFMWWIRRSEFGATLVAIREDEVGAEMRGINTTRHKLIAFAISAFFTGIVGGMWAFQNTYIDPDIVFIERRTIDMVMMSMLGGLGTVAGPVIGATIIYMLRDILWANLGEFHLMVQGILLIVLVLFVPNGIVGFFGDKSGISIQQIVGKWLGSDDTATKKEQQDE